MITFNLLFKKFRLRAEFATLSEFGKVLADDGFVYEDSIFSRWQRGDRIPHDRGLLISILKVFIKRGGITSLKEINSFLESAGQGYITKREINNLSSVTHILSTK